MPANSNMQSTNMPGVYFIGLDGLKNFRSRYLRGIRNDARFLADIIQADLSSR